MPLIPAPIGLGLLLTSTPAVDVRRRVRTHAGDRATIAGEIGGTVLADC
jgi:hypothetical protein